jgi:Tol biopolymer transport system component
LSKPHYIRGLTGLVWTPDGNQILFGKGTVVPGKRPHIEVWRVPVRGGKTESTDLAMPRLRDLSIHPDGRRLAFAAGRNEFEVWVMENFLPKNGAPN